MEFLKMYNVDSTTYKNRVGIWVTGKNGEKFSKEEKIGAIGLRLKNWITYHGLSFNIKPEMKNYGYINACGLANFKNTSLSQLGIDLDEEDFELICDGHVPLERVKGTPNAIIMGSKKGGTRALIEFVKLHHKIKAAGPEIHYFDRHYDKGIEWYISKMKAIVPNSIKCDLI